MTKWTWLVLLAIALLGGGYYLTSYQKSREVAAAPPGVGKYPSSEELDSVEESGEPDKDGSGFEMSGSEDASIPPEDAAQGLGMGGQEGSTAADIQTFDDPDSPAAGSKAALLDSPLPQSATTAKP
ncbi:MAG: hypothetical protein NTZ90_09965 [Proteobacteria bacterium]|nr:hypothetical protein [Pseudomonadota bacterium]